MLEFNEQHKSADLSTIKPKLDRAKQIGKVVICGIMISATQILSGCETKYEIEFVDGSGIQPKTAIRIENGNALIIDIKEVAPSGAGITSEFIVLETISGEKLMVNVDDVEIIEGENSREIAEKWAESLISENGKITYYEDIVDYGRSR